jgi:hypothetical protein
MKKIRPDFSFHNQRKTGAEVLKKPTDSIWKVIRQIHVLNPVSQHFMYPGRARRRCTGDQ